MEWQQLQSITTLYGFLELTEYYHKFIKDYRLIAAPLTIILKRNSFQWSDTLVTSFNTLKHTLAIIPVLQLPNFAKKKIMVECDALGSGIGTFSNKKVIPLPFSVASSQINTWNF